MAGGAVKPVRRVGHLDSLRGVAALYVVLYHLALVPQPAPYLPSWLQRVILNGWSGVPLFFVLSAWTLVMMRDGRQTEDHPDARFLVRRWFRIVPLYYAWLALMIVIVYGANAMSYRRSIAAFLTFTYNFDPAMQQGLVWASWTLGVEMVFYAMFPLVWRVTRTPVRALIALLVAMAVATSIAAAVRSGWIGGAHPGDYLTFSLATALPAFAFGVLAYRMRSVLVGRAIPPRLLWLLAGVGWLVGLSLGGVWASRTVVFPFAYTCLLLAVDIAPPRMLQASVPRYLGRISYSLYLNHPQIVLALSPIFGFFNARLAAVSGLSFLAATAVACAAVIGVSAITFRWIEEPGNATGRLLLSLWRDKRIESKESAAIGVPEASV